MEEIKSDQCKKCQFNNQGFCTVWQGIIDAITNTQNICPDYKEK